MTERTLKQLVGAFAILLVVWLGTWLVGRSSGSIEAPGDMSRLFDGIRENELEAATFVGPVGEVTLAREDGGWTVDGHRADPTMVARFLDALSQVEVGDLTATNPSNHDRMGVSADSAVAVTLEVSGEERSFLLGHAGRRFGTAYVRMPGSDAVYLLDGELRSHVTRTVDSWRDRIMTTVDTAGVDRLDVAGDGGAYTLVRTDSAWTLEGGGEVDGAAVQGILSELSNLVATGFLSESDSVASTPQASETTARSAGGAVLATVTLGRGDGDRWARVAGDDVTYRLSSFRAERIAPSRDEVVSGGS